MPPESKKRRQSAEAAFKGRQRLQELQSQAESSESHKLMQAHTDITASSMHVAGEVVAETQTSPLSEPDPSSGLVESQVLPAVLESLILQVVM